MNNGVIEELAQLNKLTLSVNTVLVVLSSLTHNFVCVVWPAVRGLFVFATSKIIATEKKTGCSNNHISRFANRRKYRKMRNTAEYP